MSVAERPATDWAQDPSEGGMLTYMNFVQSVTPTDIEESASNISNNYRKKVMNTMPIPEEQPFSTVEREAKRGDLSMQIELGIRYYTGFTVTRNKDEGLKRWRAFTAADTLAGDPADPAFRAVLAKACRCLSAHWFDKFVESQNAMDLFEAAKLSNDAATLANAVSPVGLLAAARLSDLLRAIDAGPAEDAASERGKRLLKEKSAELGILWGFLARRNQAMEREESVRRAKVRRAPNAYECARDGCGLRAGSQTMLRKCAGPCPPELKPHYCSKECQKKDWPVHKRDCKGRTTANPTTVALPNPPLEGSTGKKAQKDKTLSMLVPNPDGTQTLISSSTMSPEFMKEVQEGLASLLSGTSEVD